MTTVEIDDNTIVDADISPGAAIAQSKISGLGTAAALDAGTAIGNVVTLSGTNTLPALDGSQLTNLPSTTLTAGSVTTTEINNNTIVDADISANAAIAQSKISGLGTAATLDAGTATGNVVTLSGANQLPALDGSQLTNLPSTTLATGSVTTTEINDATIVDADISPGAAIAQSKISGLGTAATLDAGTAAGNVVTLSGANQLPALDGSQLTNLPSTTLATGSVTTTEINDATITNADISPGAAIAQSKISGLGTAASLHSGTAMGNVVTLSGTNQLPALDGSLLTNLPSTTLTAGSVTTLEVANATLTDADISPGAAIAQSKISGLGTAAALDAGTAIGNVVTLSVANQLPALDGSQLTNLPSTTLTAGSVTTTEINDATIVDADISPGAAIAQSKISGLGTAASLDAGTATGNVVTLSGMNTLPALDGSQLTNLTAPTLATGSVTTVEINDATITNADISPGAAIAQSKISGLGTAASLDAGAATGNVVTLSGANQLPALDGSQLTNLPVPPLTTGSVTTAEIDDNTIVDADISPGAAIAQSKISGLGTAASLDAGAATGNVVTLSGANQLPALDGSQLTNLTAPTLATGSVTTTEINDATITNADISPGAAIAQSKISGLGTAASLDAGTAIGNVVTLSGANQLPALDGSQLTNLPAPALAAGSVTTTEINDATITNADISPGAAIAQSKISGLGTAAALDAGVAMGNVVTLSGRNTLPALDGSQLTNLPSTTLTAGSVTTTEINDATIVDADISANAAIAQSKISGLGTAATLDAGTAAGNVVTLSGANQLSALDGSQLTNLIAPPLATGSVTTTEIAEATIIDADISPGAAIAQSKISGLGTAVFLGQGAGSSGIGSFSTAVGSNSNATGQRSTAIGKDTDASRDAIAIGFNTSASGINSIAIGKNVRGLGNSSLSIGNNSEASGVHSVALLKDASASGERAIAIGERASADTINAIAIGARTQVSGSASIAIGRSAQVSGSNSVAIGVGVVANVNNSIILGGSSHSVGIGKNPSTKLDVDGTTTTDNLIVTGTATLNNLMLAAGSVTTTEIADATIADIDISPGAAIAQSKISGLGTAVFLGENAGRVGIGYNSTALGKNSAAGGDDAIAIGNSASASGEGTIAIGHNASTSTRGNSIAIGQGASATGSNSVAIGVGVVANVNNSIVLGSSTHSVGIGKVNPSTKLDVGGTTTTDNLIVNNNTTTDSLNVNNTITTNNLIVTGTATLGQFALAPGSVTTTEVADSTLTDADISSTAAIAQSKISGLNSTAIALGQGVGGTWGIGNRSTAVGNSSEASALESTALGRSAAARGVRSTAIGVYAFARTENSTALGHGAQAGGFGSMALGLNASANGINSIAVGTGVTTSVNNAIVLGSSTQNVGIGGDPSTKLDVAGTTTTNDLTVNNTTTTNDLTVTGTATLNHLALVAGSVTTTEIADSTLTDADISPTAAIAQSKISGLDTAIVIGQDAGNLGIGENSTALGRNSSAVGENSTALGNNSSAIGYSSIAIGYQTFTTRSAAIAIGYHANIGGDNTIAIGYRANAGGVNAIAIGKNTFASGVNSVAIGAGASTTVDNTIVLGGSSSHKVGIGKNPSTELDVAGTTTTDSLNVTGRATVAHLISTPEDADLTNGVITFKSRISRINIPINTTVTRITAGIEGQEVILIATSSGTPLLTIKKDAALLRGNIDFIMKKNDVLHLAYYNSFWREISRTVY